MGSSAITLFPAAAALFGLLIGSFLNVCIYRIVREQSVVTPRSYCPACGQDIAWFDNIPVLSYILLRGECRHCGEPISIRYPIVEVLTALIFALVGARYGMTLAGLKWFCFEAILIALFFTDLEERLLPDKLTISGGIAGLVFALVIPMSGIFSELFLPQARPVVQSCFEAVVAALLLTLPLWGLAAFWSKIRGLDMLGMGDVKMLPVLGIFLGIEHGITALLIGSLSGVVIGGGYMLISRKPWTYELPLGTFFCLGAGLVPLLNKI